MPRVGDTSSCGKIGSHLSAVCSISPRSTIDRVSPSRSALRSTTMPGSGHASSSRRVTGQPQTKPKRMRNCNRNSSARACGGAAVCLTSCASSSPSYPGAGGRAGRHSRRGSKHATRAASPISLSARGRSRRSDAVRDTLRDAADYVHWAGADAVLIVTGDRRIGSRTFSDRRVVEAACAIGAPLLTLAGPVPTPIDRLAWRSSPIPALSSPRSRRSCAGNSSVPTVTGSIASLRPWFRAAQTMTPLPTRHSDRS